jgi:hypothetical protein
MELNDLTVAEFLRHEIAHCNGWPWDHPNKRNRAEAGPTVTEKIPLPQNKPE